MRSGSAHQTARISMKSCARPMRKASRSFTSTATARGRQTRNGSHTCRAAQDTTTCGPSRWTAVSLPKLTKGAFVDYEPTWSPAGNQILFVSSRAGDLEERQIWSVAASGGEPVRLSGEGLCARPSLVARRTANRIPSLDARPNRPRYSCRTRVAGAAARQLTESRPDPGLTADFVQPEAVTWPSKDGMTVHGVLLRPHGASGSSRPAIMYFHGKGGINLEGWGGLARLRLPSVPRSAGLRGAVRQLARHARRLRRGVRAGELPRLRRWRAR